MRVCDIDVISGLEVGDILPGDPFSTVIGNYTDDEGRNITVAYRRPYDPLEQRDGAPDQDDQQEEPTEFGGSILILIDGEYDTSRYLDAIEPTSVAYAVQERLGPLAIQRAGPEEVERVISLVLDGDYVTPDYDI